jgi:hypothetical protein
MGYGGALLASTATLEMHSNTFSILGIKQAQYHFTDAKKSDY